MNAEKIKSKIVDVLKGIQTASGLDCPPIKGTTKPTEELPKFDSKIWPVATGMIGLGLNINIPVDVNIFRDDNNETELTIDQIVEKVMKLAQDQYPISNPKAANQ